MAATEVAGPRTAPALPAGWTRQLSVGLRAPLPRGGEMRIGALTVLAPGVVLAGLAIALSGPVFGDWLVVPGAVLVVVGLVLAGWSLRHVVRVPVHHVAHAVPAWGDINRAVHRVAWRLAVVAALLVVMWPARYGGFVGFSEVVGRSMTGTYATGDVVVTLRTASYDPGEVVVFHQSTVAGAPDTVVHRIVGSTPTGYVTRGDANPANDPWHPTANDIAGRVVLHLPMSRLASALGLDPALGSRLAFGLVIPLLCGLVLLVPRRGRHARR